MLPLATAAPSTLMAYISVNQGNPKAYSLAQFYTENISSRDKTDLNVFGAACALANNYAQKLLKKHQIQISYTKETQISHRQ